MGNKTQSGFTIIEVVLFLAISALLLFVLMAGTASQINRQRYNDGIRSVQVFLQQQYDETLSVINDRQPDERCTNTPEVVPASPATAESRGTSRCIILGKAIQVVPGGQQISAYHVVGLAPLGEDPLTAPSTTTDAELIDEYKPTVVPSSRQSYDIPWGMTIADSASFIKGNANSTKRDLGLVALLRSPRNGGLVSYSYSSSGITRLYTVNINDTHNRVANICLENQDFRGSRSLLQMGTLGTQNAVTSHPEVQGSTDPEMAC